MMNILIIGATSTIAIACARRWAETEARFFLVARNAGRLEQVADDLATRGATVTGFCQLDIDDFPTHAALLQRMTEGLGDIDIASIAPGTLPDQRAREQDPAVAVREFNTNAVALIALLTSLENRLETQERGVIAVISSVARDRGRPSNYLYGSAKAALSTFCEWLRARLAKSGVHLLTIKPGFVATPMTVGLPPPRPLVAMPEKVASDIVRAVEKRKDVLYTPWFLVWIMLIIRSIPQRIFKRLSI